MKELEINNIASAQRLLIWAFIISIVGAATKIPIIWFPAVIFLIFCAYKTSKAMEFSTAASVFWGMAMLLPGLSTICILILNYKITFVLRAHGLKVGLLGVKPSDLPTKPAID